jgi:polyisoprenoid-binding protein YceI
VPDTEWFDAEGESLLRYRAVSFRERPDGGFVANGELTVKSLNSPLLLTFRVINSGGRSVLEGEAQIDRKALQVSIDESADTRRPGQFVRLVVHVETFEPIATQ